MAETLKKRTKKPARVPTTHDYTRRGWGHDYAIHAVHDEGLRLRVSGWGHGISEGDYILLQNGTASTRYTVLKIDYHLNPSDMWAADLMFAPRENPAP